MSRTEGGIRISETDYRLKPGARLVVFGAGKVTLPIAEAFEVKLSARINAGTVILRRGEPHQHEHIKACMTTDAHVPSAGSGY